MLSNCFLLYSFLVVLFEFNSVTAGIDVGLSVQKLRKASKNSDAYIFPWAPCLNRIKDQNTEFQDFNNDDIDGIEDTQGSPENPNYNEDNFKRSSENFIQNGFGGSLLKENDDGSKAAFIIERCTANLNGKLDKINNKSSSEQQDNIQNLGSGSFGDDERSTEKISKDLIIIISFIPFGFCFISMLVCYLLFYTKNRWKSESSGEIDSQVPSTKRSSLAPPTDSMLIVI